MTTTINISLPTDMYKDAKKEVSKKNYASVSELVREGIRNIIYEDETWETEEDVKNYFRSLREEIKGRNGKNQKIR